MPQASAATEARASARTQTSQRTHGNGWAASARSTAHHSPSLGGINSARESSPCAPVDERVSRRSCEDPLTARGRKAGTAGSGSHASERRAESQQQLRRRLWLQERHLELDRVRAELRASAPGNSPHSKAVASEATVSAPNIGCTSSGTDRRRLREELRRVRSPGAPMGEDPRRVRSPGVPEVSLVERRESGELFTPRRDRLSLQRVRQMRQRSVGVALPEESPERGGDAACESVDSSSKARTRSLEDSTRCLQKARDDAALRRQGEQACTRLRGAKPVADGGESSPRSMSKPFAGSLSGSAGQESTQASSRENTGKDEKSHPTQLLNEAEKVIRVLQEQKDRLRETVPPQENQPPDDTDAATTVASEAASQAPRSEAPQETSLSMAKDPSVLLARSVSSVDVLSASTRLAETTLGAMSILSSSSKQQPVVPALQLRKWPSQADQFCSMKVVGETSASGVVWSPPLSARQEETRNVDGNVSVATTMRSASNAESVPSLRSPRSGNAAKANTGFPFASSPRLQSCATSDAANSKSSFNAPLGQSRSSMLATISTASEVRRNSQYPLPQSPAVQDRMVTGRPLSKGMPMAQVMTIKRIPSPTISHVPARWHSTLSPRGGPPQITPGVGVRMVRPPAHNNCGSNVAPPASHVAMGNSANLAALAGQVAATSVTAPPAGPGPTWQTGIVRSSSTAVVEPSS